MVEAEAVVAEVTACREAIPLVEAVVDGGVEVVEARLAILVAALLRQHP